MAQREGNGRRATSGSAAASDRADTGDDPEERRVALLGVRIEEGRLGRAEKLAGKVGFAVSHPDLVVASVGKYNVVVDADTRRIQHACRDFQGQFREGRLCKHVAAVLLALDPDIALPLLESMADPDCRWSLEVIKAFGSR